MWCSLCVVCLLFVVCNCLLCGCCLLVVGCCLVIVCCLLCDVCSVFVRCVLFCSVSGVLVFVGCYVLFVRSLLSGVRCGCCVVRSVLFVVV